MTGAPHGLDRLIAIAETRRALLHAHDRDDMLEDACRIAVDVAGLRMAWIGLVDPATRRVSVAASAGHVDGYLDGLEIVVGDSLLGAGPTGQALASGDPVVSNDIATDPAMLPWRTRALDHGFRSSAAIPIRVDDRVIGALNVYAGTPDAFQTEATTELVDLALDIGVAVERLQILDELHQARQALQRDLAHEQAVANELRRVDEMKNAFLSAVSHELRTPLTAVRGFALTLLEHLERMDADAQRDLIRRVLNNAERLAALIEDLLDIDRINRGMAEPHRRPVRMLDLVREVVKDVDVHGHSVAVTGDDVEAYVDRARTERILEHLVVNAARHTPAGTPIEVRVQGHEKGVAVHVLDEGPGIATELRAAILEPFRQGAPAPVRGAGLGLTTVRHFAELHGGSVTITSRSPRGTDVRVWLPDPAKLPVSP